MTMSVTARHVISDVSTITPDDSQLVSLEVESGNCLQFQPHTSAQCNMIQLDLYKKATTNTELKKVKQVRTMVSAYGRS